MSILAIQCPQALCQDRWGVCFNIMEIKKYTFNRIDKNSTAGFTSEEVNPERWGWGVIYKDDTELKQFGDDGVFHQFREIETEKVKMFIMYQLDDMNKQIDMPISEGMQFFHFYRNIRTHYSTKFSRVYVFGFKKNNVASYNFILPDDRIIISAVDNIDLSLFNI